MMVSHDTTLVPPLRLCIGPTCEAALVRERGHVPPRKRKKKEKAIVMLQLMSFSSISVFSPSKLHPLSGT